MFCVHIMMMHGAHGRDFLRLFILAVGLTLLSRDLQENA